VLAAPLTTILSKLQDNEAVIIDDLAVPAGQPGKTKEFAAVLKALAKGMKLDQLPVPKQEGEELTAEQEAARRKKLLQRITWLIGIADYDPALHKSVRNIRGVELMPASQFNAYTVLRQKRLVLTRAALEALRKGPPQKTEAPAK
jgi:large subunit ribosomal protein L4